MVAGVSLSSIAGHGGAVKAAWSVLGLLPVMDDGADHGTDPCEKIQSAYARLEPSEAFESQWGKDTLNAGAREYCLFHVFHGNGDGSGHNIEQQMNTR